MKYSASQLREIDAALEAGRPPPAFPEPMPRRNDESRMQQKLARWWASVCDHYDLPEIALMAFPMQGARTEINAARMKNEGCRKGTLDMLLMVPRRGCSALWIENKTEKGDTTKEQDIMIDFLLTQSCQVAVCHSLKAAQEVISNYLT